MRFGKNLSIFAQSESKTGCGTSACARTRARTGCLNKLLFFPKEKTDSSTSVEARTRDRTEACTYDMIFFLHKGEVSTRKRFSEQRRRWPVVRVQRLIPPVVPNQWKLHLGTRGEDGLRYEHGCSYRGSYHFFRCAPSIPEEKTGYGASVRARTSARTAPHYHLPAQKI